MLYRAAGEPDVSDLKMPFTDVKEGSYCYDAVKWAVSKGITEGTTATTFAPSAPATRGQVVTFLYRAAGKPDVADVELPFTDVKEGSFCYDAVLWAYKNGITNGQNATTFGTTATCNRGNFVTLLYRSK